MKHILIPVDFSDCSLEALKYGSALALKTGSDIRMVHVIAPPEGISPAIEAQLNILDKLMNDAKEQLASWEKLPILKDVKVKTSVVMGNVHQVLMEQSSRLDDTVIVMGSHGASGFSELFIGSVTQKIIRLSDCPVFTIKNGDIKNVLPEKIIFASEFPDYQLVAFKQLDKIFSLLNAKIEFLYVNTRENYEKTADVRERMEAYKQLLSKSENVTFNIHNDIHESDGIINFAREAKCDLITMITHGRTGLARLLWGSLTEELINHADINILSLRSGTKS